MNSEPEPPRLVDRRKLLWWAFWFIFFTTPVCSMFLPNPIARWVPRPLRLPPVLTCCAGFVLGAFAAGFVLANLTSKADDEFISRGIGYGLALIFVYAVIALAGCFLLIA